MDLKTKNFVVFGGTLYAMMDFLKFWKTERFAVRAEALLTAFHYAADRKPVAIFAGFFLLDLSVLALDLPLSLTIFYAVLAFFPKAIITAWNHHHQHVQTFKHAGLNLALEVMYGFQTGVLPSGWVLHHNLGHHPNYMKGAEDESAWITSKGRKLGEMEYTFRVGLLAYAFIFRNMARFDAKHGKRFLMGCVLTGLLFYGLWTLNPRNAVLLFLIPPVCALFGTVWFTYKHHAGLDTQVAEEASWNVLDPFYNKLTGNLGYHTAHHISCGTHWSKLPELHARISKKIPKDLYREPGFPFPFLELCLGLKLRKPRYD